jgi:hypothetical protein
MKASSFNLRVWVDGKTGGRWLIAKHRAVEVLKRHIQKVDARQWAGEKRTGAGTHSLLTQAHLRHASAVEQQH